MTKKAKETKKAEKAKEPIVEKKTTWVLEMSIQEMAKLVEFIDHSEFDALAAPAVLVFSTDDGELSVDGFETLGEAKSYMEAKEDDSYEIESAYFEGREMEWTDVRKFDFVEKKKQK